MIMFKKAKNVITTGVTVIGTVTDATLKAAEALPTVMDATGSALSKGGELASQLASSYAGDLEDFIDAREAEAGERAAKRKADAKVRAERNKQEISKLEQQAADINAETARIRSKALLKAELVEAKALISLVKFKLTVAEAKEKAYRMTSLIAKAKGNVEVAAQQMELSVEAGNIAKLLKDSIDKPAADTEAKPEPKPAKPEAETEAETVDIQPDFSDEDGASNRFGM